MTLPSHRTTVYRRKETVSAQSFEVVSPAPRDQWLSIVRSSDEAMAFHSPSWSDVICASGRWRDASRLYVAPNGRQLVIPMVRRGIAGGGWAEEASAPYGWGFGGVIGPGSVTSDDVEVSVADISRDGALKTSLRPNPLSAAAWSSIPHVRAVRVPRSAHVLDLGGGFEEVWASRFTGAARTAVRKAEREGMQVERDSTGRLLPEFYDLYGQSVERWCSSRYSRWRSLSREPLSKFEKVFEHAGHMAQILMAWQVGRPVAAIITLTLGKNTNYWRGAMNGELAGPTRANYLLHRTAIADACEAGCLSYHMGETGQSASLAQFKTRFGARRVDYDELRFERLPFTELESRAHSLVATGRQRLQSVLARKGV
jgi:hypothetical protein